MRGIQQIARIGSSGIAAVCLTAEFGYLILLIVVLSSLLYVSQTGLKWRDLIASKEKVTQSVLPGFESVELNEVLRYRLNEFAVFIDSRLPAQYRAGHIPGAVNIPPGDIASLNLGLVQKLSRSPAVVVYCNGESCPLAAEAALSLTRLGLQNVKLYGAGWPEWHSCGLPIAVGK